MKRSISERDHHGQFENVTMANCLMLLSRSSGDGGGVIPDRFEYSPSAAAAPAARVFECKTCNRQFPSFQALGGHRASHKKPRRTAADGGSGGGGGGSPAKPKTHECTVCGLEFAVGQALGGHMRRHRTAMADSGSAAGNHNQQSLWMSSADHLQVRPVVKKISSNSGRRVLCLDLNLTPLENDIKILQLGNPLVNIF